MQVFGESELILTHEGERIYHLNLHPDEIADTVITVGDPNRVPMVSKYFDRIEVVQAKRELVTHTGYVGNKRLTVLSTGMSTANIDIVLNELDALHNICFKTRKVKSNTKRVSVVRIGTSGAMQPDIPVGSFLLSEAAVGFDGMLHFYDMHHAAKEATLLASLQQHFQQGLPIAPYMSFVSPKFLSMFDPHVLKGITVTCGGFYAAQGRNLRAKPKMSDFVDKLAQFAHDNYRMTNFEMETAGIYGLGRVLGFDYCSLNLILANRFHKQFIPNPDEAMDRLIKLTIEKLAAN
ncbi:MAG: phosphorylase [Gammaproteobacteria bacterium]|jgi:uridine phosphorylase|nr:phosphorylase [Gammaproteobacteria bacterium]